MAEKPINSASVSQIREEIMLNRVAYNNRYEMVINFPIAWTVIDQSVSRSLSLRCESVIIPGRAFSTTPYRLYGPARNMPYEQIFTTEANITVILSESLVERNLFEGWMNFMSSPTNYKMRYYDEYIGTAEISVLNKQDEVVYKFLLDEVYPRAIGDIQMGYDRDNEIMKQDITLSFRKYTTQKYARNYSRGTSDLIYYFDSDQPGLEGI